jgi:dTDP-4-dehydrorhamnose 3,5-epimerase
VRVLKGAIVDIAVDIRPRSPSFGKWVDVKLTAESGDQVFVPRGFAHGYCTLEDDTEVAYKCDYPYVPSADAGFLFSDPTIAVKWPVSAEDAILSDKDRSLPLFADLLPVRAV